MTVVDGLKMEYPIVYAYLRYDELRSLPNELNTIKIGRLRSRLIDLVSVKKLDPRETADSG